VLFKSENAIFDIEIFSERWDESMDRRTLNSSCFNGAYKEFIELIGYENTLIVHDYFAGQYVTFPKKLLSEEYLHQQILSEYDGKNAKDLARKYGYSYSWVMKILKRNLSGIEIRQFGG